MGECERPVTFFIAASQGIGAAPKSKENKKTEKAEVRSEEEKKKERRR